MHPPRCCVHGHNFSRLNWVAILERVIATVIGGGILWILIQRG